MSVPRYVIRITYPDGQVAWLREGTCIGFGPIVRFRSTREAERHLAVIQEGLYLGTTATIVRVAEKPARTDEESP